jgi:hypothetical protein
MTPRTRRCPRWYCHVELDPRTREQCKAWGIADDGEDTGDLQHQHYLEHHYTPPSEDDDMTEPST